MKPEGQKQGALLMGCPQQVIDKILSENELFGLDRFLLHMRAGTMPHAQIMHLFNSLVIR